jgi:hypothetical protein
MTSGAGGKTIQEVIFQVHSHFKLFTIMIQLKQEFASKVKQM